MVLSGITEKPFVSRSQTFAVSGTTSVIRKIAKKISHFLNLQRSVNVMQKTFRYFNHRIRVRSCRTCGHTNDCDHYVSSLLRHSPRTPKDRLYGEGISEYNVGILEVFEIRNVVKILLFFDFVTPLDFLIHDSDYKDVYHFKNHPFGVTASKLLYLQ